jgi:hypothetical protein
MFEKKRSAIRVENWNFYPSEFYSGFAVLSMESGLSGDMIGLLADATDSLLRRCYWTAYMKSSKDS